jgi:hypothetical protein
MIQRSACLHFQRSMLSKPGTPNFIFDFRCEILDFEPGNIATIKLLLRRTLIHSKLYSPHQNQPANLQPVLCIYSYQILKIVLLIK